VEAGEVAAGVLRLVGPLHEVLCPFVFEGLRETGTDRDAQLRVVDSDGVVGDGAPDAFCVDYSLLQR